MAIRGTISELLLSTAARGGRKGSWDHRLKASPDQGITGPRAALGTGAHGPIWRRMSETRPRRRRTGSKDDRITAPAPKRPLIRVEIDREALAAIDKRTLGAQLGVGLAAGWLASWIVGGSGLLRYMVTGLVGAFVGGYVLDKLGIDLGIRNPVAARIVTATLGASLVVVLARLLA